MLNSIELTSNDPLELAEQCLALITAVVKLDEAPIKESLQFILQEKMAALFVALDARVLEG
ncbi:hypothetical protein I2492_13445 [Budviciaceae bacterium CWB-B4]|uniref:Uncharacterized protein n=1 Tax=Limnobaculum xujianqingii TaxID=2738837 RepID=A0A9D7AJN8_9GAMM|nr:hypothetical protein [Limnobaculum xujianqingii]MBK5073783.1 hypothetical protein [Limnobaculum xujianqingii]MBK5177323.1 hypothetical protein [Limnobaculum xujianqingii]